jgi:hypothetical protein
MNIGKLFRVAVRLVPQAVAMWPVVKAALKEESRAPRETAPSPRPRQEG